MKKTKKQRGFALMEVMLAALVMTVGGVAYMKLQQRGLQYNFNNYARTQGIAITQDFVELLRSNVGHARGKQLNGAIKPLKLNSSTGELPSAPVVDCKSDSDKDCSKKVSEKVSDFQKYLISQQMMTVTDSSVLCYREHATSAGYMRVTYIWQDNSKQGKEMSLDCPAQFNTPTNQNNSVTIYAQL